MRAPTIRKIKQNIARAILLTFISFALCGLGIVIWNLWPAILWLIGFVTFFVVLSWAIDHFEDGVNKS